ncbi:carbohydrate porin, partial [bacterium]|nr:carbohydrate porin [bacterium]
CHSCGASFSSVVPYGYDREHPLCQKCCEKEKAAASAEPAPYDILTTKKLTGDWWGARTAMQDAGVDFAPMFISIFQQNFRGGANTHNGHDITGRFFYNAELDFEKMLGWRGATFFYRAVQEWNNGIGSDVGTTLAPYWGSGAPGNHFYGDSPYCILTDKWWYRQRLLDDRIEIRLGKLLNVVDLFDKNAVSGNYASAFMNRALNYSQTIPVAKGTGAFVKMWPTDWLYFQTAAVNADSRDSRCFDYERAFHGPAHYVGHWEFGLTPKFDSANGELPGNYRFGWWYNPRMRDVFMDTLGGLRAQQTESGDVGWYMSFDQMLLRENNDPKDAQGLGVFFRYGYAHGEINRIAHTWSVGTTYKGLIPRRDKDELGFGVAQCIESSQYRDEIDRRADRETVYELYYAIELTPWCIVTPDIQVITNPGGSQDARDALVGGVRAKITF